MGIIEILVKYKVEFLLGLGVTVKLCLIIWSAGLVLGTLLGVAAAKWRLAVGLPLKAVSFVLAGVPVLVFLFWMHYPLQSYLGIVVNPFYTAAATLSIVNILLVSDLIKIHLLEFPDQYMASARVCGLSYSKYVRHIQFPIIVRQVLPPLLVIQVTMLHSTLFASLISVDEVFRIAQRINSQIYKPVEIYSGLAFLFLAVSLPLHGLSNWLKARFTRNLSER